MRRESVEPGSPARPIDGEARVEDRMTRCPERGHDVQARETSYGASGPSAGRACPSCGALIERF